MTHPFRPPQPKQSLSPAQLRILGLQNEPFTPDPAPDTAYRDLALDLTGKQLLTLARSGRCTLLLADEGTGKSTLLKRLPGLSPGNATIVPLEGTPQASFKDMQQTLQARKAFPPGGRPQQPLTAPQTGDANSPLIIVIDDADLLPADTLQAWMRWHRMQSGARQVPTGLILAGHPRLAGITEDPVGGPVDPCARVTLRPLTREQTEGYLHHRLVAAGAANAAMLRGAVSEAIHRESSGIPSRIDTAARRELRLMAEGETAPAEPAANRARRGNTAAMPRPTGPWVWWGLTTVTGLMVLGALVHIFVSGARDAETDPHTVTLDEPLARVSPEWAQPPPQPEPADSLQAPAAVPETPMGIPLGVPASPRDPANATEDPQRAPDLIPRATDRVPDTSPDPATETPGVHTDRSEAETAPVEPPMDASDPSQAVPPGSLPEPLDIPHADPETGRVTSSAPEPPARSSADAEGDAAPEHAVAEDSAIADDAPETSPDDISRPAGLRDPEWLRTREPGHFTIQISAGRDLPALRRYAAGLSVDDADIGWFRTRRGGEDWYSLVLGDYPDRQSARAAESALPADIRQHGPWIRSFGSVQDSMR